MPYDTQYPTNIPNLTDLPSYVDNVDDVTEETVNDPKVELLACLNELGTLPSGSTADLTTRLAVSLNDDGTLKSTLSPTFVNLTLSGYLAVNGNDITSTGVINMKAGGDNDDYLYFSTVTNIARLYPSRSSVFKIGTTSGVFAEGWFDKITCDGDLTLDPAGDDILFGDNLRIKHVDTTEHFTELFNNDADTGWYWNPTNRALFYKDNNTIIYEINQYGVTFYLFTWSSLGYGVGGFADAQKLDDSSHGAASTPLYIGNQRIVVENTARNLGAITVGDGGATNYCEIKADGEINLHGTARVNRHIYIAPAAFKFPGANPAGEGITGLFATLDYDDGANDEEAYASITIPFRWASGTDITVVISWFYTGVQDNGFVVWGIEYKGIKAGEAVAGAGTSITQKSAGTHTTDQVVRTTFATKILGANLEADDDLGIRVYRHSSDGVNDTLAKDAKLLNIHLHFIMDKLGSPT